MPAIIRHNLGLKIIALVGAIAIWIGVNWPINANQVIDRVIEAEVLTSRPPEGLEVVQVTPPTVNLTLAGAAGAFTRTDLEQITVVANVQNAELGTQSVELGVPELPEGLELIKLHRRQVQVELDEVIDVLRQVEVVARGRPAEGFATRGWQVKPETVNVSGAASHVRRVADVVAIVDVSGRSATLKTDVSPEARDENNVPIEKVKIAPDTVAVTVPIMRVNTKTVPVTPTVGQVPNGYRLVDVKVSPTTVTISGSGDRLKSVEAVNTGRVDISDLRGTSSYPVPLQVPDGVTVIGANSARVTVTLRQARRPAPARRNGGTGETAEAEEPEEEEPAEEGEPRQGGIQKSPDEQPPSEETEKPPAPKPQPGEDGEDTPTPPDRGEDGENPE